MCRVIDSTALRSFVRIGIGIVRDDRRKERKGIVIYRVFINLYYYLGNYIHVKKNDRIFSFRYMEKY